MRFIAAHVGHMGTTVTTVAPSSSFIASKFRYVSGGKSLSCSPGYMESHAMSMPQHAQVRAFTLNSSGATPLPWGSLRYITTEWVLAEALDTVRAIKVIVANLSFR